MKNRRIMQPAKPLLPVTSGFDEARLLAPAQALALYASRAPRPQPRIENVALAGAAGRVLARAVRADAEYPAVARSSMDGFAMQSAGAPGRFRIVADVHMGRMTDRALEPGEAATIPTGGALPAGADAVVPVEHVVREGDGIVLAAALAIGANLTPRGSDMRAGEAVLHVGRRIGAPEIGVLATLGVAEVPVFARPRIAVLSSGDELVDVDATPSPAQIRDSNRYVIAASLRAMGAQPVLFPIVSDEPGALASALLGALADCDAAVLSGGSSVGERDATPAAVHAAGEPGVIVHGLRIRPGKPTVLGCADGKPVIGLPGNPVSALMVLEAVAAPIVAGLVGAPFVPGSIEAVLAEPLRAREGWTTFIPVALEDAGARILARPLPLHSTFVSLPARAAGYVVVGERASAMKVNDSVSVCRFSSGGNLVR